MVPTVYLGSTGEKVPILAVGTYGFKDSKELKSALIYAFELGINHIDTAEMYTGAEEVVGEVIKEVGRRNLIITSKVLPYNGSFKKVIKACENSLKRMETDFIDIYLLHFYTGQYPVEETLSAFEHLVKQGKIRFYGVSNFELREYDLLKGILRKFKIQNNQIEYNLSNASYVENQLLPLYSKHSITPSGYSPFWQGRRLTARMQGILESIAEKHRKTIYQVILNFLTRNRNIFIIFKSENRQHVRENLDSLSFSLDRQDVESIKSLSSSSENK